MKNMLLCLAILPLVGCDNEIITPPHNQCAGVKAKIGMLSEEVLAVCGEPERINRTEGKGYHHEQWVYKVWSPRDYVYIDDGKVSTMQW